MGFRRGDDVDQIASGGNSSSPSYRVLQTTDRNNNSDSTSRQSLNSNQDRNNNVENNLPVVISEFSNDDMAQSTGILSTTLFNITKNLEDVSYHLKTICESMSDSMVQRGDLSYVSLNSGSSGLKAPMSTPVSTLKPNSSSNRIDALMNGRDAPNSTVQISTNSFNTVHNDEYDEDQITMRFNVSQQISPKRQSRYGGNSEVVAGLISPFPKTTDIATALSSGYNNETSSSIAALEAFDASNNCSRNSSSTSMKFHSNISNNTTFDDITSSSQSLTEKLNFNVIDAIRDSLRRKLETVLINNNSENRSSSGSEKSLESSDSDYLKGDNDSD
jgi:hypothetical protein